MLRSFSVFTFLSLSMGLPALALETRCGWLFNPTPGNWFLTDRDESWVVAVQGGFRAKGLDTVDLRNQSQYVRTNGNYGYACACMDVNTDRSGRITKLQNFKQLNLQQCLEDPKLPSPK